MKQYDTYKPSGIEWLGDIPEHWEVKRVKEIGNVVLGKMLCNTPQPGYLLKPYLKSKNIGWIRVNVESVEEMYFSKAEMKQYKIKKNDLLLSEGGEVGKTCIWNDEIQECYIQNSVHKISFPKYVEARYYLYFSFATGVLGGYESIVNFISIKHLTYEKLNRILWTFPPFQEQTAIANYLDTKTAAIDRKIELLTAKADKYKALRRSLINETVCRGLNPNAPLKDSGIEWIGKIPEHWEVKRVKDHLDLLTGNSISDKTDYEDSNNSIPYVATKDIEINSCNIDYENGIYIPRKELKNFKTINPNSILLCIEGGSAGKKIAFNTRRICFVNKLCSFSSKGNAVDIKYNFYQMQSAPWLFQFNQVLNGLIGGVSISLLKTFRLITPPRNEQAEIAIYLDNKTTQIDTILTNIGEQINKLTQLRKTLINDVVTGKIKVTGRELI